MLFTWSRLSQRQKYLWGYVAGVITVGTVFKVCYFKYARKIMVDDAERRTQEGLEHLREARAYSEWSRKDREARLPQLTPEQREQMRQYLQIVEKHGLAKAFADAKACVGCPVMKLAKDGKNGVADDSLVDQSTS